MRALPLMVLVACGSSSAPPPATPTSESSTVVSPHPQGEFVQANPVDTPVRDRAFDAIRCAMNAKECAPERVVVITFWSTQCKPCIAHLAAVKAAKLARSERDVVFVTVVTDNPTDEALGDFADQHQVELPMVMATSEIRTVHAADMKTLPTTVIYGPDGNQVHQKIGPLDEKALGALIDPLVKP